MRTRRYFIPTHSAQALVAPYKLSEILADLKDMRLIECYEVGPDVTRIESSSQKRFELASIFFQERDIAAQGQQRKRTVL